MLAPDKFHLPKAEKQAIIESEKLLWNGGARTQLSEKTEQLLKETACGLREIFGDALDSVILYGSYARGEQTEESDVDVMAKLCMPAEEIRAYRRTVSALASDLGLRYDVLISIKLQDKATFDRYFHVLPFYQNVARDGVTISA